MGKCYMATPDVINLHDVSGLHPEILPRFYFYSVKDGQISTPNMFCFVFFMAVSLHHFGYGYFTCCRTKGQQKFY